MSLEDPNRSAKQAPAGQRAVQAVALGALMACAVAAPAAERAVSVIETVQLSATAGRAWAAINDFAAWQSWHPAFAGTQVVQGDGRSKGTVRVLTTKDGGKFTEELIAFDAVSRSYQYRII